MGKLSGSGKRGEHRLGNNLANVAHLYVLKLCYCCCGSCCLCCGSGLSHEICKRYSAADSGAGSVFCAVLTECCAGKGYATVDNSLDVSLDDSAVGAGACCKTDINVLSTETLRDICAAVNIPVVAIGGIGKSNISQLADTGVDGVALVSAIFAADDIESECRLLRKLSEEMVNA